jgi:hypothetical protein
VYSIDNAKTDTDISQWHQFTRGMQTDGTLTDDAEADLDTTLMDVDQSTTPGDSKDEKK